MIGLGFDNGFKTILLYHHHNLISLILFSAELRMQGEIAFKQPPFNEEMKTPVEGLLLQAIFKFKFLLTF